MTAAVSIGGESLMAQAEAGGPVRAHGLRVLDLTQPGGRRDATQVPAIGHRGATRTPPTVNGGTADPTIDRRQVTPVLRVLAAATSLVDTATTAAEAPLRSAIHARRASKRAIGRVGTTLHDPAPVVATACPHAGSSRRGPLRRSGRLRSRPPAACAIHVNKLHLHPGNANSGSTTVRCGLRRDRPPHAPSDP